MLSRRSGYPDNLRGNERGPARAMGLDTPVALLVRPQGQVDDSEFRT